MRNGWTGRILWVTAALWLAWTPVGADTWLLEKDGEWQNLAEGDQGRYVVLVSRIKRLIADGQVEEAHRVLDELTEAYPSVSGPDLKAFMEAETLYAKNEWDKAIRQYNAFMDAYPDSWLYEAALEREYSIAVAYLSGEKRQVLGVLNMSAYDEAATILHNIADRAGDAPIAQRALVALARNYAERGEFMDAYETWAEISARWPTGELGQTALLEMAQSLHSAYKSPAYDQTPLISARSYYRNFELRYPEDAEEKQIDQKIDLVREQLAYKQYITAEYYERTDHRQAANLYYQLVVDNWPETTAAKMARARIEAQTGRAPALPSQKKKAPRKVLDATTGFLDSWFGLEWLFGGKDEAQSEG